MDKSKLYDLNVPVGTWMGAIKVENEEIWNEFIKTGIVKGFSIEGYFADKIKPSLAKINDVEEEILAGLELLSIKQLIDEYKS
jgi:hypothetical protein